MDTIISYIPVDRRIVLSQGRTLPTVTIGSALFADISGFTPLTAAYVQKLGSRQGVEELIRQIINVYDALIIQIHHYGSSAIYFSGDAITCWFDESLDNHKAQCGQTVGQSVTLRRHLPSILRYERPPVPRRCRQRWRHSRRC